MISFLIETFPIAKTNKFVIETIIKTVITKKVNKLFYVDTIVVNFRSCYGVRVKREVFLFTFYSVHLL